MCTVDLCYPLRCENEALCQITGDQASCVCAEGYTGARCETGQKRSLLLKYYTSDTGPILSQIQIVIYKSIST